MNQLLKAVARCFACAVEYAAYMWSYVYTLKVKEKIERLHTRLYYMWVKRHFKKIGRVFFHTPAYLHGMQYISIDDGTHVGHRAMICAHKMADVNKLHPIQFANDNISIEENPEIVIGKNCNIGDDCNIQSCNSVRLGNGVRLGRKVMINDTSHGDFVREQLDTQPNLRPLHSKGSIVIEDNVWIGEMVCILANVHIGRGSVIGAGAVVTKDIPPYSLAVGSPAKVIKSYQE